VEHTLGAAADPGAADDAISQRSRMDFVLWDARAAEDARDFAAAWLGCVKKSCKTRKHEELPEVAVADGPTQRCRKRRHTVR
jgi:hypothetical protein